MLKFAPARLLPYIRTPIVGRKFDSAGQSLAIYCKEGFMPEKDKDKKTKSGSSGSSKSGGTKKGSGSSGEGSKSGSAGKGRSG